MTPEEYVAKYPFSPIHDDVKKLVMANTYDELVESWPAYNSVAQSVVLVIMEDYHPQYPTLERTASYGDRCVHCGAATTMWTEEITMGTKTLPHVEITAELPVDECVACRQSEIAPEAVTLMENALLEKQKQQTIQWRKSLSLN